MKYRLLPAFIGVLLATLVSADEIVILSPHPEAVRNEFELLFNLQQTSSGNPEVLFRWIDVGGGTSDILKFVKSEFKGKPDGIGIDLFFGGGTEPFLELSKLNLLQSPPSASAVIQTLTPDVAGSPLFDSSRTWFAASISAFGILCNKPLLDRLNLPFPEKWSDLGDPKYAGWIELADPRKSGSAHLVYEIVLQAYGWEKGWAELARLSKNARAYSPYASQVPRDVAVGEIACGPTINSAAFAQMQEVGPDKLIFQIPKGESVVNGDGIAMLRGAPNRALADKFLSFVLSEEGQRLWILKAGDPDGPTRVTLARLSVRPELYQKYKERLAVFINPFEGESTFRYDSELGALRWGFINDLMGATLVDPHPAQRIPPIPVTEDEANHLVNSGAWGNPVIRNSKIIEWGGKPAGSFLGLSPLMVKAIPSALLVLLALGLAATRWARTR